MEVSFLDLREKEVVNVFSGKRLGRVIDLVFDVSGGNVIGLVVPGDKKVFRKSEDIFIPLSKLKRIGSDVILVGIQTDENFVSNRPREQFRKRENIENYYDSGIIRGRPPSRLARADARGGAEGYDGALYANSNYGAFYGNALKNKTELSKGTPKIKYESQSQSNNSFIRLRPLESKKYK